MPYLKIAVHARWAVAAASAPITLGAWDRLPSYVTRYAQTLGVPVHAIGGADDHLHLLFDLPTDKSFVAVNTELERAVARFLADLLPRRGFAWSAPDLLVQSVGAGEWEELRDYIAAHSARHAADIVAEWEDTSAPDEDSVPVWLRDIMPS